jgi:CBS domain-containing protein
MKVRDLMSSSVETCSPGTSLADAAMIMWRCDCGIVPVVEPGTRTVVGTITDRDVCMGLATSGLRATERTAQDVMARSPATVKSDDDVEVALGRMEEARVRRLPVLDPNGSLAGVLSVNDLVLATASAHGRGNSALATEDVMRTLRGISEHRKSDGDRRRPARRVQGQG